VSKKEAQHVIKQNMKADGVKKVRIKSHHAKPYRKRHYAVLVLAIIGAVILLGSLITYRDALMRGIGSSKQFISSLFTISSGASRMVTIASSEGISLGYDQAAFYASALDTDSKLYVGDELTQSHAYRVIRLTPATSVDITTAPSAAFTATIHPVFEGSDATAQAFADAGLSSSGLKLVNADTVSFSNREYSRSTYELADAVVTQGLKPQYTVYTTMEKSSLLTIVVAHGTIDASTDTRFDAILESIAFDVASVAGLQTLNNQDIAASYAGSTTSLLQLLDFATNTQVAAAAAETVDVSASERIAALYSSATVKVYNVYCMDVTIDSVLAFRDYCQAGAGSGFIVNAEGYIGTNGHVATASPVDAIIKQAIYALFLKGDATLFNYLADKVGLTESDLAGKSSDDALKLVIDTFYTKLDDSSVKATNSMQNLVVSVTSTPPDVTQLIEDTNDRKAYTEDDNVVPAKLIDSNYKELDGPVRGGFTASDVALIKLQSGSNYPTVKLGSIDNIEQGSSLSILGYPGNASDNSIVGSETANATLTNGKVSSIKNANGSDLKVIETDTTIGHGNSGGPAMNDNGQVVGVATYSVDASGAGDGTYNYIRDIADFEALLDSNGVKAETSETQTAWEMGMDKYYNSHYKSALKYFETVADLYPNHTKVDKFIASAQTHIDNGDDVSEFPMWTVWVGLGAVLLIMGGVVILIVRHSHHHATYKAGVAQGTIQPMQPGMQAPHQEVVVAPGQPVVQPMAHYQQQQLASPGVPQQPVAGANDQQPPTQYS